MDENRERCSPWKHIEQSGPAADEDTAGKERQERRAVVTSMDSKRADNIA